MINSNTIPKTALSMLHNIPFYDCMLYGELEHTHCHVQPEKTEKMEEKTGEDGGEISKNKATATLVVSGQVNPLSN